MILALAIGSVGLGAPTAAATPSRDLYMVKDVQATGDGTYVGDFAAVRKKGKSVVGAVGSFYSEYTCIRGRISGHRLRGTSYNEFGDPTPFSVRWKGSGAKQRIKGFTRVTKADMRLYGGSNPTRMIKYCVRNT